MDSMSSFSLDTLQTLKEKYQKFFPYEGQLLIDLMKKIETIESIEEFNNIFDQVIKMDVYKLDQKLIEGTTLREFRDKLFNPLNADADKKSSIEYKGVNIPVIVIDDYPFDMLVSVVKPKEKESDKGLGTYKISQDIVSNPSLWLNMNSQGSDKISTSHLSESQFVSWPSDNGVICGFSNIEQGQIFSYASIDDNTSMDIKEMQISKADYKSLININRVNKFITQDKIHGDLYGYNEIRLNRYKLDGDGSLKKYAPDYMMEKGGGNISINTLEWARTFNIPIVTFNKKKIFDRAALEYQELLNNPINSPDLVDKQFYLLSILSKFTYDSLSQSCFNNYLLNCEIQYSNNNTSQIAEQMVQAMENGTLDADGNPIYNNSNSFDYQGKSMGYSGIQLLGLVASISSIIIATLGILFFAING